MQTQNIFNQQTINGIELDPIALAKQANEIGKTKNVYCTFRDGKWNFMRVVSSPNYQRRYWIGSTSKPNRVIPTIKSFRSN